MHSRLDIAGPPYLPHKRDSVEAHLTIVFAALAVSRWIEEATGWSIKKLVRTARRYRTAFLSLACSIICWCRPTNLTLC
jgi:hypothetical protein